MDKRLAISISALFLIVCAVLCTGAAKQTPLRDGFLLSGVDGKLTGTDDKWLFEFYTEVSDDKGKVSAGSTVALLPSAALEKMVAEAEEHPDASYRLWGSVTKYRGGNFIFPIYFLPLSAAEDQNKPDGSPDSEEQKAKIPVNEPNDILAMPEEIVSKLRTRRVLRRGQLKKGLQLKQDYILADRTALLDDRADGEPVAVLDALGRNIQQVSIRLLPCEVLERAQYIQSKEIDPVRFKIAGIITQFKDEYYLLLQRAIRAYSHENFGR